MNKSNIWEAIIVELLAAAILLVGISIIHNFAEGTPISIEAKIIGAIILLILVPAFYKWMMKRVETKIINCEEPIKLSSVCSKFCNPFILLGASYEYSVNLSYLQ